MAGVGHDDLGRIMNMSNEEFEAWCREWRQLSELDPERCENLRKSAKFNEQLRQYRYARDFPSITIRVPVTWNALMKAAGRVVNTVVAKNHDYGDAWQALGSVGATARFVDKIFRIEHLANGQEALVVDEKLGDTVQDLVGYGLLIMLYLEATRNE